MRTRPEAIRTVLVDDEPLARRSLRVLLEEDCGFEIVAECRDGNDACRRLPSLSADLLFLDVQMPGCSGLEVLQRLDLQEGPLVVFVTAFDEYAVRAFEHNAVDYLLKPFDDERFRQTLDRVRRRLEGRRLAAYRDRLRDLAGQLEEAAPPAPEERTLVIRSTGRTDVVPVDEIDWIGGAGNYAEIHAGQRRYFYRELLSNLERDLDPRRFVRIHRSTIVNRQRVRRLEPAGKGAQIVRLEDGTELRASPRYREALVSVMEQEAPGPEG